MNKTEQKTDDLHKTVLKPIIKIPIEQFVPAFIKPTDNLIHYLC